MYSYQNYYPNSASSVPTLLECMRAFANQGDSCVSAIKLHEYHAKHGGPMEYRPFKLELEQYQAANILTVEDDWVYLTWVYLCENQIAEKLTELLRLPCENHSTEARLSENAELGLCQEQRDAVQLALGSRFSMILGGAGTGKTTVIQALIQESGLSPEQILVCAPTGKAAQVLRAKLGFPAETVHRALGASNGPSFLNVKERPELRLIIVDEAGMLTLEMFRGILYAASENCRIVLVGDNQQLAPVGCGDVIRDCCSLGLPHIWLQASHRQEPGAWGLSYNIRNFVGMACADDMAFDSSFQWVSADETQIGSAVVWAYAGLMAQGTRPMVLSPLRDKTRIGAQALNQKLQKELVPYGSSGFSDISGRRFFDGDPIILTKNNRERGFWNGDIGRLQLCQRGGQLSPWLHLENGRNIPFGAEEQLSSDLAYAMTVHKAQGSEYDAVIIPISSQHAGMLRRDLLYTAISRARKQVILIGNKSALDQAICRSWPKRKSRLLLRVNGKLYGKAA